MQDSLYPGELPTERHQREQAQRTPSDLFEYRETVGEKALQGGLRIVIFVCPNPRCKARIATTHFGRVYHMPGCGQMVRVVPKPGEVLTDDDFIET